MLGCSVMFKQLSMLKYMPHTHAYAQIYPIQEQFEFSLAMSFKISATFMIRSFCFHGYNLIPNTIKLKKCSLHSL